MSAWTPAGAHLGSKRLNLRCDFECNVGDRRNSMTFGKFGFTSLVGASALLAMTCLCVPATMHAGTVILEGSDAIGLHCPSGNVFACAYTAQVWKALDGSSGKPIAVIGDTAGITSQLSGITISNFSSV